MIDIKIKEKLNDYCVNYINDKIAAIEAEMRSIQSSANEETKSSAGDKYETSRAMMMLEKEKFASQREEAFKMQKVLNMIDPDRTFESVALGTLVETDKYIYYISVGIGKIDLNNQSYFAISPASPIGNELISKKVGEEIEFNGKKLKIRNVC